MLKCALDKHKILNIKFDMPVPGECMGHSELQHLLKAVEHMDKSLPDYTSEHALSGLRLPLSYINPLIDGLLEPDEAASQKKLFEKLLPGQPTDQKQGLDINFHQNPFDTPERYWNFILNQGHFASYFFNRLNWFLGPSNEYVTDFPLHVDLESASTCNMNCPMCYRNQLSHTGQMDFELFQKAVDECARHHVFSIRLSWRGETLTHPRIKEMIAYACSKIKNVSFLTNAFYLDEDMIDAFISSGVGYIAVSFDGIKDIYEKIRHPAVFEENFQRLLLLKQKREQKGAWLPQVRLCTIWPAIKNNPEEYYTTMKPVSDYIVCNPYINFKGPMKIKPDFICQYPWERIVIGYNGDTQCCTGWNADDIILGNIQNQTIHEMWHGHQMNAIRKTHARGNRMSLNSCAECRHGSKGDPDIGIEQILERHF